MKSFAVAVGGGKHDDPTDVLDEIELDPEDPDFDSDVDVSILSSQHILV